MQGQFIDHLRMRGLWRHMGLIEDIENTVKNGLIDTNTCRTFCVANHPLKVKLFGTSVVVPNCYLFLLSVFILWFSYYVNDIF